MACPNCRSLIELLQREITQLTERVNQLQRINDTLSSFIKQQQSDQDIRWKQKYQQQVVQNMVLEKQLRQINKYNSYNSTSKFTNNFGFPSTPKSKICVVETSSQQKQNRRSSSISKMDNLMRKMVSHKVGEFKIGRSNKKCEKQIVLRIVDQRLGNIYR